MTFKNVEKIIRQKSDMKDRLQAGFTLIELLVAIAISALLTAGLSTSIFQIITINASSSSRMTAIKQVENAVAVMREDIIMAKQIIPDALEESGFPLTLKNLDWGTNHQSIIVYSLNENKELVRQQIVTDLNNPSVPVSSNSRVIARDIESIIMPDSGNYSGGKITFLITANLQGFGSASETRSFDIYPRTAVAGTPVS
jgi:prepilin-type N-terminal cleavage/methylation domain-containing protein